MVTTSLDMPPAGCYFGVDELLFAGTSQATSLAANVEAITTTAAPREDELDGSVDSGPSHTSYQVRIDQDRPRRRVLERSASAL